MPQLRRGALHCAPTGPAWPEGLSPKIHTLKKYERVPQLNQKFLNWTRPVCALTEPDVTQLNQRVPQLNQCVPQLSQKFPNWTRSSPTEPEVPQLNKCAPDLNQKFLNWTNVYPYWTRSSSTELVCAPTETKVIQLNQCVPDLNQKFPYWTWVCPNEPVCAWLEPEFPLLNLSNEYARLNHCVPDLNQIVYILGQRMPQLSQIVVFQLSNMVTSRTRVQSVIRAGYQRTSDGRQENQWRIPENQWRIPENQSWIPEY